jgi:membrane fusion protein (multidrug efflux system)
MTIRNPRASIGRLSELIGRRLRLAAVASLAAFVGCGGKQQETGAPPPEVTAVTLEAQAVSLTTELPGRTAAYRIAEVRPQVGGVIVKRLFTEGAEVQAGQQLYQIDSRKFVAELERATANVKRAQAELEYAQYELRRVTNLKENEAVAEKEYQDAFFTERAADAAVDLARSEQRTAALNLEWSGVVAPISGRIGYSSVTEGALVTAQQPTPLTTIQQIDPIYVNVMQASADLLRLKRHWETGAISTGGEDERTVRMLLEDGTPYSLDGVLQFRDITVDPTTDSYTLRIVLPNPQCLLLPGMFVRAVVQEGTAEQAILVPQQGVTRNPKGEAIALVVDDARVVQQRKLSLDRAIGDRWLVSAGLAAGDRVIVEGLQKVRPGMTVKEIPFEADRKAVARTAEASQPPPPN